MKKIIFPLIVFLNIYSSILLASSNEYSESKIQNYFEILKHDKVDFQPDGAVCERVALREIEAIYPSVNFILVNGIQYDDQKSTIGELDLVVFDKSTHKVEAIAEVKCWKSFEGALKKVKVQRMRFQLYLNRNITLTDNENNKYNKEDFKNVRRFFSISQEGGLNQGFDFELSLNLKELTELRKRLLDCSAQKKCPVN